MTRGRRIAALCRFAAVANLRSTLARIGFGGFVAVASLGQLLGRFRAGAAPDDDRLFGAAFLVGAVFLLRSGLAEHRKRGTDLFLRHNFLSPGEQLAGHCMALVVQLAGYCAVAFLTVALVGGGDLRFAAWYTAVLGLGTALFLPAVLVVELASDFRLPFVLVPIGLLLAMGIAEPLVGADRVLVALGLRVGRYDPATLVPLMVRVLVMWPLTFGLLGVLYSRRHRRHGAGSWTSPAPPGHRSSAKG